MFQLRRTLIFYLFNLLSRNHGCLFHVCAKPFGWRLFVLPCEICVGSMRICLIILCDFCVVCVINIVPVCCLTHCTNAHTVESQYSKHHSIAVLRRDTENDEQKQTKTRSHHCCNRTTNTAQQTTNSQCCCMNLYADGNDILHVGLAVFCVKCRQCTENTHHEHNKIVIKVTN